MEAGPCPSCGNPPATFRRYVRPRMEEFLAFECRHCGERLTYSWQGWTAWSVLLVLTVGASWLTGQEAVVAAQAGGSLLPRLAVYLVLIWVGIAVFGTGIGFTVWKRGWWSPADEREPSP